MAGVVLALRREGENIDRRVFLAGLLDWRGDSIPKSNDLESLSIIKHGFAHIKAITENGGEILGEIKPCWNFPDEIERTDSIRSWGYGVIRVYAEKYFGPQASNNR